MNYLAHGFRLADAPWTCAGAALPDWLRVLDRRLRIAAARAEEVARGGVDGRAADLARGVLRHYADDLAFHTSEAFRDVTRAVAELLRASGGERVAGLRPSFVAHILVESLLDAELVREEPRRVGAYYGALAGLDPAEVERVAARLTPIEPVGLASLVRGFVAARFVEDYLDDGRLVRRLDLVFRRVRQPAAASAILPVLPAARREVARRLDALVPPPR